MLEFKSKITVDIPELNSDMTAINLITQRFATDYLNRRSSMRVRPLRVRSVMSATPLLNVKTHLENNSAYINAVSGVLLRDF